ELALEGFRAVYPMLGSIRYDIQTLDLETALDGADLVLVHEWSDHELVRRIGDHRKRGSSRYRLLFHDTHHRSVTDRTTMAAYDLSGYDGVLAFGSMIRDCYLREGWAARAWTWHEAADTRVFHPIPGEPCEGDLVWIGNWGDEERTAELRAFLFGPVRELGLTGRVHGVRYPEEARRELAEAGLRARQLGGRGTDGRAPCHPVRARARARPDRPRPRCALSRGGAAGAGRGGAPLCRLAPQLPGAWSLRPLPRHRPCATPPLYAGASRHPDHPHLRSPGLRHPPGLGAVGGHRPAVLRRRGLSRRLGRRRDDAAPARPPPRPGDGAGDRRPRP